MVIGMATGKLTITLDEDQIEEVRRMVAAGRASSISGFVQHAVRTALHDAAGWQEMLDESLAQTGGPLTAKERAWADALLSRRAASARGAKPRKKTA
jgi:Arc/MetJ-type ribon-helix-helix transcriptional regulator